jgi:hypothetical protein
VRAFAIIIAVLLAGPAAGQGAEEISAGKLRVTLSEDGFIASASIGEQTVADASAKESFRGVILDAFQPSDREPDPAAACVGKVIPGRIATAQFADAENGAEQRRTVQAGPVTAQFNIKIAPAKDEPTLTVDCQVLLTGDGLVSAVGLAVPLLAGEDPYLRKTTVGSGNAQREMESWRANQRRRQRGWPPWILGGLSVPSDNYYLTWKASRRDTPAMRMDEGTQCPGWLDYSQKLWGVTVIWKSIHKSAPAAIWMEADTGTLSIFLHPPDALALPVTGSVKLAARIELAFHEGPHPTTVKRELTEAQYRRLLEAMDDESRYSFLAKALSTFNCLAADDLLRNNVQPSRVLAMEGGANYRINALCRKLGIPYDRARAKSEPRKYGQELIHKIITKLGGQTSFKF